MIRFLENRFNWIFPLFKRKIDAAGTYLCAENEKESYDKLIYLYTSTSIFDTFSFFLPPSSPHLPPVFSIMELIYKAIDHVNQRIFDIMLVGFFIFHFCSNQLAFSLIIIYVLYLNNFSVKKKT